MIREHIPMYQYSLAEAKRWGQIDAWRESYKENCACARAIEDAIRQSFDGMYLQDDCAKSVIDQFGMNRVNYVLANTIREKNYDGRFSPSNKTWAKGIHVPKDSSNWAFIAESHPAVLDGFVTQARAAWNALGLYGEDHIVSDSRSEDYTGKVLVVSPTWLKDCYLTPEYQLFHAKSGFGCSPTASGRKVYGTFLYDGENTNLDRSDFLGILKDEHLPQWAREKLEPQSIQVEPSAMEQSI